EVPTPPTANPVRNFKSKSGTRIMELLVQLCFRSSCQSVLRRTTNFENGALDASRHAGCGQARASTDRLMRRRVLGPLRPVFFAGFGARRRRGLAASQCGAVER